MITDDGDTDAIYHYDSEGKSKDDSVDDDKTRQGPRRIK
jgi:hypothetical protein